MVAMVSTIMGSSALIELESRDVCGLAVMMDLGNAPRWSARPRRTFCSRSVSFDVDPVSRFFFSSRAGSRKPAYERTETERR